MSEHRATSSESALQEGRRVAGERAARSWTTVGTSHCRSAQLEEIAQCECDKEDEQSASDRLSERKKLKGWAAHKIVSFNSFSSDNAPTKGTALAIVKAQIAFLNVVSLIAGGGLSTIE
jgi:hypothetical protein